jgi:competence ComEA-like helix-hairpin-helix protein
MFCYPLRRLAWTRVAGTGHTPRMATNDDRRAALVLVGLAVVGLVVRLLVGGHSAPGAMGFRPTQAERPVRDSVTARSERLARPLRPGEKVDLDRAAAVDLSRLPRIGPGLAARIVADRDAHGPFGSLSALDRVSGIGPSVLEAVRPYAMFSGRPTRSLSAPPAPSAPSTSPVSLNRATAAELATLPGIGPTKAQAIVESRAKQGPFRRVEDLQRVPGIGPATLERLRGRVRVP